jgi:surface antigen
MAILRLAARLQAPAKSGQTMAKGIHRIKDGWVNQHSVLVKYDEGQEMEMPEDRYRSQGYQPAFENLPWKPETGGSSA